MKVNNKRRVKRSDYSPNREEITMNSEQNLLETNIEQYLEKHQNKELVRFLTCGSVDDGKSTLIGRLLHDSKMIF